MLLFWYVYDAKLLLSQSFDQEAKTWAKQQQQQQQQQQSLSFNVFFPSFSLVESSPRDLHITAYK